MKRTFILTLLLMLGLAASAQINRDSSYFNKETSTVHSDDNALVHDIGLWVRSHIYDNWYLNLQAGGNLYGGYDDWKGPFLPHLGYSVEAKIGRWVFPVLGYRFGIGVGSYHGYLRTAVYNENPSSVASHAGGMPTDGFPGYYQEYNDDLLRQSWTYGSLTGDMMIRLISAKKYQRERQWVPYLMFGVNFFTSFTDPNLADGAEDENPKYRFDGSIHGGMGLNCRLSERWSIYAEARASMQGSTFDREFINFPTSDIGRAENPRMNEDWPVFLHFGAEYRFNWRREVKRNIWEQTADTNLYVKAARTDQAHQWNYNTVFVYDTLYTFDTIAEGFSPEMDSILYRRALQQAQDKVDSLARVLNDLFPQATLRDIFESNLLPYEMVFFQLDKWGIQSQEEIKIRKMADIIRSFPGQQFLLIGSADSKTGTVKRNDFLSVNRADVVYNKLVYEYKIDPTQLQRVYLGGILDYEPYELNRATVIIMDHPKVMEEFNKLRGQRKAGGSTVKID